MKYNKCHSGIIIRTRWDGHDRTDGPTTYEADGNDDRIASQLLNRCHVLFVVYVFSCMSLFRSLLFIFKFTYFISNCILHKRQSWNMFCVELLFVC